MREDGHAEEALQEGESPYEESQDELYKELATTPYKSRTDAEIISISHENLADRKQVRRHRTVLFYLTISLVVGLLGCFCYVVCCTERLLGLLDKTPFILGIVAMLGLLPTFLLISLFKSVFKSSNPIKEIKEGANTLKDVVSSVKDIIS